MRARRSYVGAVIVVALSSVTACSDDEGGGDEEPAPLRIDGPAEVDPDFDPFATVPPTTGG